MATQELNSHLSDHVELFRYLRTLVDTAEQTKDPYPKFALVEAYWHIGRIIVETEQDGQERADYGIHLIESLSQQLTQAFGKGYSLPNMWRFKQFFLAFQILSTNGRESINLRQHLRIELSWSHYRFLMQLENRQERAFYVHQAADERWTVRLLQKLVRSRYYYQSALGEDHLLATTQKPGTTAPTPTSQRLSAVGGTPRTRLATIKKILLERHVGYAFVGQRQFISIAGQDRWIELIFFHFILNRFVLVQLAEHDPASTTSLRQLVDSYLDKQATTVSKPPVGLLINQAAHVKVVTTSAQFVLPPDEDASLPRSFV